MGYFYTGSFHVHNSGQKVSYIEWRELAPLRYNTVNGNADI